MLIQRAFQYRWWVELFAWIGLTGLFVVVHLLPVPNAQRLPLDVALFVLGLYAIICLHVLFPRWGYAPRLIYVTLVVDVFIIGVFRFLLTPYLPDVELGFIPLILIAALVADER